MDTNEHEELASQDLESGLQQAPAQSGSGPEAGGDDLPIDPETGQPVDPDPVDDANPETTGAG